MIPLPQRRHHGISAALLFLWVTSSSPVVAQNHVYVSRFWHNHQPIYWPEWNGNGSQTSRVQFAWDSIVLKNNGSQSYGTSQQHPDNNLPDIFGLDDRKAAYQGRPRDSLTTLTSSGGFSLRACHEL
jgi:hypothetical protein